MAGACRGVAVTAGDIERTVYCVSDHTGVTAEAMAHSLIARFEGVHATYLTRPFIDDLPKVEALVVEINESSAAGPQPIVFSTITDPELWRVLRGAEALVLGLFELFVDTLAAELGIEPSESVGRYHGIRDTVAYQVRLDAVDYALSSDDGLGIELYQDADVIVIGVSRVGKTPACLYLAMQYGIRAANFPLTPESLDAYRLPAVLEAHADRLFGLTIDPVRLYQIRQKRRPDSDYASLERCGSEVSAVERLYRTKRIPILDTTARSIEEITATVIEVAGLERRLD